MLYGMLVWCNAPGPCVAVDPVLPFMQSQRMSGLSLSDLSHWLVEPVPPMSHLW
jgi:hypothetical protein